MEKLPKHIRKQLRELAGQAYENELGRELQSLSVKFDEWKAKKIDGWELTELIHRFHNGAARQLYGIYNSSLSEDTLVGRAVANGLLTNSEIPEEVWSYIREEIDFYQRNKG